MNRTVYLEFLRVEDACCILCNAVRLADCETTCVSVQILGEGLRPPEVSEGKYFCLRCVAAIKQAADGVSSRHSLEPEVLAFVEEMALQRVAVIAKERMEKAARVQVDIGRGCPGCGHDGTARVSVEPMGLRCTVCDYFLACNEDGTFTKPVKPEIH